MNSRILFKSFKLAFRSRRRVISFIIIYAILYIAVGKGLVQARSTPGAELPWLGMALIVSTIYAILISQFRRRDIAILKCVAWANDEILLLLIGEVFIVSLTSFLVVFQLSIEILGIVAYIPAANALLQEAQRLIIIDSGAMAQAIIAIIVLQLPGLAAAHRRMMHIPPMRALREE